MNSFEIMTLVKGSLGEEKSKEVSQEIHNLITSLGGKATESDVWGKRKLAYKIRQQTEGFYEVINFELDSSKVDDLKSKLNLMDNLVRYLVTAIS